MQNREYESLGSFDDLSLEKLATATLIVNIAQSWRRVLDDDRAESGVEMVPVLVTLPELVRALDRLAQGRISELEGRITEIDRNEFGWPPEQP